MQWVTPFPTGRPGRRQPRGGVVEKDGVLYGTAEEGGSSGAGTVFKVTGAGVLTKVYDFGERPVPFAGLTLGADRLLYGTTNESGANFRGTVFRLDPSATPVVEQTPATPSTEPTERRRRPASCSESDGRLFGTTSEGGPGGTAPRTG